MSDPVFIRSDDTRIRYVPYKIGDRYCGCVEVRQYRRDGTYLARAGKMCSIHDYEMSVNKNLTTA